MSWPLNAAGTHYLFEGDIQIPVSPETGAAIIMLRPVGGIGVGTPAIADGPPGMHAQIDTTINRTSLAWDDPTAETASWTVITPPDIDTPGLYRLNLSTRRGQPGDDGDTVLDPDDFGGGATGDILYLNEDDEFELSALKRPEVFYPGSITNVGSGNANFTMTTISIPSRPWARRVRGVGFAVVTGEASDVRVNLLARLDNASSGNVVGRCVGIAQTERLMLSPGKPIESGTVADTYDQIAAGASATLYIRTERSAGSSTYTASASSAQFSAETLPL